MAYIDNTRRSRSDAWEVSVCITKNECNVLLPYIQKAYKSELEKCEKYEDIHQSGEATERQEILRIKYEEKAEHLGSLISAINDLIK